MSFIKEYFTLSEKHVNDYGTNTIVLTQNGAFFEVYGLKDDKDNISSSQLSNFARLCDLNIVGRKTPGGGDMMLNGLKVVNAGFKTHLLEKYVKKIQEDGFTIVVYEETGDDPVTHTKIRAISGIYSPGTFFSPTLDEPHLSNYICCLWIETYVKNIYMGVGVIDIFTGESIINEFEEEYIRNPITFDELERFLAIFKPSETIIVTNLSTSETNDVINFIDLKSKSIHIVNLLDETPNKNIERAKNCEKQTYQLQLLQTFYEIFDVQSFMTLFYEHVFATQAFCFLLDFVFQHNPYLVNKLAEPKMENTNNLRVILANHSLKQLNIVEDDNQFKGKYSSVCKMLNECLTPMGKRKFQQQFLNPITDEILLQQEYDIIDHFLNKYDFSCFKNLLAQTKDIHKIIRQIIVKKVSPKSLYYLYQSLSLAKSILELIENDSLFIEYLSNKISSFPEVTKNVETIQETIKSLLVLEECAELDTINKMTTCIIQQGVDDDLDFQLQCMLDSQDKLYCIREYFNNLVGQTENKPKKTSKKKCVENENDENENEKMFVSINETEKNNFSLQITDRRSKILQEHLKNISSTKHVYMSTFSKEKTEFILNLRDLEYVKQTQAKKKIISSQLDDLCRNISSVKTNLIAKVCSVYEKKILIILEKYQHELEEIGLVVTYVDLVFAKAFIANKYNYCKPSIKNDANKSFVDASNLRHCLIEKLQQNELYIANDIKIGCSDRDGMLLYGTNAVGKTSLIRSLGIAVIMAQSGMYVAASSFHFKPYKHIFTRILGNDNIFKGLSTFAVEMSELRTILRLANENSLVLGDELCSGTESVSAISIFVAGVLKLAKLGCSFIFATHLHEIIHYEEIETLRNVNLMHMTVQYDMEKDCLIYDRKLKEGPGNSMYGLEVCKSLHLPKDFLDCANTIREKYHVKSVLQQKRSHYNALHISGGECEKCKKAPAVDVHHLQYQQEANEKGIIERKDMLFNKNAKANLLNLCEKCHDEIHQTNKKYKKTKTTKGMILEELV
jgi:DNA mismatch repair protein MutS